MIQKKAIRNFISLLAAALLTLSMTGCGGPAAVSQNSARAAAKTVGAGETWIVDRTTRLESLVIADGAVIKAPEGFTLSLTVDGVETGQELVTTEGVDTYLVAGSYRGDVILTVSEVNTVSFQGLDFPIRQALYLDETGVVAAKSVLSAVAGDSPTGGDIENILIRSTGECFNGIYVSGGDHTVRNAAISLTGNGRSDFPGYGAAVVATGADTRLVLDGVNIGNEGVVRTALIAAGGSNVIVKNSRLETTDGDLPEDYVGNADLAQMRGGFPIGGSTGNCRATNLLGENTRATYINSSICAQGWGVLSTDDCTSPTLTAINSTIAITGNIGGYGTYAIGNATETFLGCAFDVAFDVTTLKGGSLVYGDSTPQAVARLNRELDLGLTAAELAGIPHRHTVIDSERFGIMATGNGTVDISGGTVFNSGETLFLNKGTTVAITVDGAGGARLNAANGVILQLMDPDDPGPTGKPYTEPTEAPEKDPEWDLVGTEDAATAVFSNIELTGDFYNSIGWGRAAATSGPGGGGEMAPAGEMPEGRGSAPGGPDMASVGPPGGMMGGGMPGGGGAGKNMALTFDNAAITGVISSSEAHHLKPVIYINEADYRLFGVVTNTAREAVNNGVIVSLTNGSQWTVTGTSYLNRLTLEAGSTLAAPRGYRLTMTVDGVEKKIGAGDYQGQIMMTVTPI